ncbi:Protein HUA2-LIKE 3 [Linum perenne]
MQSSKTAGCLIPRAFCNPADIEPFTEEKKRSLLTKRQGKSADFVRALEEIIDSFDKAKKQDYVNDFNSCEAVANGGNSIGVQNETTGGTVAQVGTVTCRNDPTLPDHDGTDVPPVGSFEDKESLHEQPVSKSEKPVIATYTSRKRSGGSRSRKCVPQQKIVSPESPKNLHLLASGSVQNSALLSQISRETVGNLFSNGTKEGPVRRTKHTRKTIDVLEGENWDSSAFVSNDSVEDNVSEIITADSDSYSLNEVGIVDSGYKAEQSEDTVEHLGEKVQSTKPLDNQIKTVVTRKKRKLSRKQASNDRADQIALPDNGTILEVGANNTGLNLPLMSQNAKESKEDGDEHLPLLKRARVRMGEVAASREVDVTYQTEEETLNGHVCSGTHTSFCQDEVRMPEELSVSLVDQVTSSVNSNVDCPASRDLALNETSNIIPGGKMLLPKVSDNQSFGHLADGESALPLTKRLHRALEAMSANVAEETSTVKQCSNEVAPKDLEKVKIDEQTKDSPCNRVPVLCLNSESLPKADSSTETIERFYGYEASKKDLAESLDHGSGNDRDCMGLQQSVDDAASVEEKILGNSMLVAEKQPAALEPYHAPLEQKLLLLGEDDEPENQQSNVMAVETPGNDFGACEKDTKRIVTSVLHVVEDAERNMKKLAQVTADDTECDNAGPQMSELDKNHQVDGGHKPERDDQMQREASSITFSNGHCSGKDGLAVQPATEQAIEKSSAGMSPVTTSVCHMSTSESVNFNQNSDSSSPNTDSNERRFLGSTPTGEEKIDSVAPQRPKSVGRYSNAEVHAALSSFEGMLGLLTRTKENISRATRLAMDCSKLGATGKVMEILAHNLEHESSLPRRVDLFFLVDSIAQSSRGLKGVAGAFPSAIQAVLPRLILAAAPPGISAKENRRQCLKVLRLWMDRRILPESIIRHHIRDLDSLCASSSAVYSRRSARTERSLDDPIREMEGMHVDEYGSNSSFQLPGLCMPRMLKDEDEGSDSDGGSFEAVTPEHHFEALEEQKSVPAIEKHTRVLEDVDGELEMEDVDPSCEEQMSSTKKAQAVACTQTLHGQFEQHMPSQYVPPLPQEVPPSSPPLPSSPPPPLPTHPLPAVGHPFCEPHDTYVDCLDARPYRNAHNLQSGPRMNSSPSDGVHRHPECRDSADMQIYDTCKTGRAMNNGRHVDGPRPSYRHKSHPPRPQHHHLPPPNHFSYPHGGHHVKSRRETTPPASYSHRYRSSHDSDNGDFYNNHNRMRPDPSYEYGENWRYHEPPYSGPRYPEKYKSSYVPHMPYGRPSREATRLPHHQGWQHHPPRGTYHREFQHSEGSVSMANRGPNMWRHR